MQKTARTVTIAAAIAIAAAATLWMILASPDNSSDSRALESARAEALVVGGKDFTEQLLIAEMTTRLLSAKEFAVDLRAGMGSQVLRTAQENGQVDIYWEYTGTALINYLGISDKLSADEVYKKVKELDAERGLVWLNPSRANNTYALAMNRAEAKELGIVTLSDLAREVNARTGDSKSRLTLASNAEFYARADGLKPLQETYGFAFRREDIMRMVSGLTYQALKDHYVDVATVFATDGRIPAFDFVVLRDDKGYFPAYALTPVVRQEVLQNSPEIAHILDALSAVLNDETIAKLNASVDVERSTIESVATSFLKDHGMI